MHIVCLPDTSKPTGEQEVGPYPPMLCAQARLADERLRVQKPL